MRLPQSIATILFAGFILLPHAAHAACINPVGDHGDMLYNRDHTVMQYCNGTDWMAMSGGGGAGDNLGNHTASQDLDMATFKIKNAAIPTASADVPNKAYVDAAVASAAASGGNSGGGSPVCYYAYKYSSSASSTGFNVATCGGGFEQMDGKYFPYITSSSGSYDSERGGHIICCSAVAVSTSVTDDSPAPFDFPDTPNTVGTGAYTWNPIQIVDFDTAPVQISAPAAIGVAEYRICSDVACNNVIKSWRSSSTGIANGNYLQLRVGAAVRNTFPKTITITIGAMSDTATIRGGAFGVFTTSTFYDGNLGGVAGADAKCQAIATNKGFGGTWRAWISDSTSSPNTRFENKNTTSAFARFGAIIATNWSALTSTTSSPPINIDENGVLVPGSYVWTNTANNGNVNSASTSYNCTNWTSNSSGLNGNSAYLNQGGSWWSSWSSQTCNLTAPLYCFQTVL